MENMENVNEVVDNVAEEVANPSGGFLVNAGKCLGLLALGGLIAEGGRKLFIRAKKKLADRKAKKEAESKTNEDIDELIPDDLPDIGD